MKSNSSGKGHNWKQISVSFLTVRVGVRLLDRWVSGLQFFRCHWLGKDGEVGDTWMDSPFRMEKAVAQLSVICVSYTRCAHNLEGKQVFFLLTLGAFLVSFFSRVDFSPLRFSLVTCPCLRLVGSLTSH